MGGKHFLGKLSLRAVIVHDEKILLDRDTHDPDIWEIPGGRLHEDEGIEEGLKREIFEELGVQIKLGKLFYTEQFHQTRDGSLHLLLTYEATLINPAAPFTLDPAEVAEVKWIDKSMLDQQKIYTSCLNALKAYWNM